MIATRRHFWRLLGRAIDRDTASEAVTVMIVADDAGDDPLADRREDLEAVAERERKAKVAKLKSQTANAMEAVRAQQAAKERGAFDEAAIRANEVAGAPVKASSAMVASIFASRRRGKDWQMVQRREQRKTQTGAGTAAQVVESLEMVAASAIEMYEKNGADGLTVTDAHAVLVNDVALKQGMLAMHLVEGEVELPAVRVVAGHICDVCAVLLSVVRLAAQFAVGWERRQADCHPS